MRHGMYLHLSEGDEPQTLAEATSETGRAHARLELIPEVGFRVIVEGVDLEAMARFADEAFACADALGVFARATAKDREAA